MFIGHYGLAFGAKKYAPCVSLGTLFLATQFLDLLWPTFVLLGIETVRIVPGITRVTPLLFEHYPYSHSLLAVLCWGLLLGFLHFRLRRNRTGAFVVGFLVLSHWFLDLMVHRPDLPILIRGNTFVGFDAWSSYSLSLFLELSIFLPGILIYAKTTSALDGKGRWGFCSLVTLLLFVYFGNTFGPPPPSPGAIAWLGEMQWLLVAWGYWVDRHRTTRGDPRRSTR